LLGVGRLTKRRDQERRQTRQRQDRTHIIQIMADASHPGAIGRALPGRP
jgi:hypothetical protein